MAPEPEKEPERSSISSWTECSEQNCSDCSSLSSRERISDPLDKYISEQYESWEDWLSGPKMTIYVKIKDCQHWFIDQNNHVKKFRQIEEVTISPYFLVYFQHLAYGLSGIYSSMPRKLDLPRFSDPSWYRFTQFDVAHLPDLKRFLKILEFCDAVMDVAHDDVKNHLLSLIFMGFLNGVLKPALTQVSMLMLMFDFARFLSYLHRKANCTSIHMQDSNLHLPKSDGFVKS